MSLSDSRSQGEPYTRRIDRDRSHRILQVRLRAILQRTGRSVDRQGKGRDKDATDAGYRSLTHGFRPRDSLPNLSIDGGHALIMVTQLESSCPLPIVSAGARSWLASVGRT